MLASVRGELIKHSTRRASWLSDTLEAVHTIGVKLEHSSAGAATEDIYDQLADLIYEGFLDDLQPGRLQEIPRYLNAILIRFERLEQDPRQDAVRAAAISPWWQKYTDWLGRGREYTEQLDTFRWLLEEYRVSQFAQQLGTREKVSAKRLEKAWIEVNK